MKRLITPLAAALALGAAAAAQPGPQVQASLSLDDGRVAEVVTYGDGLGYRLFLEGAEWPVQRRGEPVAAVIGDIDGDRIDDVVIHTFDEEAGAHGVDGFDVSTGEAHLAYSGCYDFAAETFLDDCAAIYSLRFTIPAGLESIDRLREVSVDEGAPGWEMQNLGVHNHLNSAQGALLDARIRVARARHQRAEVRAAEGEIDEMSLDAARLALAESLAARAAFFENGGGVIID